MKATRIFFEIPATKIQFVPNSVEVDDIVVDVQSGEHTCFQSSYTLVCYPETAVDASFINRIIERVIIDTLNNVFAEERANASDFDLILFARKIIRLGKQRLMTVRYEQVIKGELTKRLSMSREFNAFGLHTNVTELFLQNAYRIDNTTPELMQALKS